MRVFLIVFVVLSCVPSGLIAQNPPANPPTTTTDPNGKACSANSVLNYIPSGVIYTCQNGFYAPATGGGGGTGTVTQVDTGSCLKGGPITTTGTVALDGAVNPQTSAYQVLAGDFSACKTITVASGSFPITLVPSGSQPADGQYINIINYGSGTIYVVPSGQNINGGTSSLTIGAGSATSPSGATIKSDGTDYFAVVGSSFPATTCSDQVVTALAVATAEGTCTTVTSAYMAVANTRRVCDISIGDESGSALTDAQLGPQKRLCYIPAASTVVEVDVDADGGTPNVIVAVNHAGSDSNIVSAALATAASGGIACSNTGGTTGINGATTCSATLQNTSMAAGDYLELVSGTAGGTAKLMSVHVVYTVN